MATRTLRSPRRIDPAHPAIQSLQVSTSPPPQDSFAWQMWMACQDIAQEALATEYIQGIGLGNLSPDDYGQYTIQDSAYCYHAQRDYKTMLHQAKAAKEDVIAGFVEARYDGYVKYNQETFASWHVGIPTAITPGEAAQQYINIESALTRALPIYGLVGMIPCEQLWPWLATQLQAKAVPTNVYGFWITGNADWDGAYRMDNFVNSWCSANPGVIDPQKAGQVFRVCMTCEVNFFRSATGQPLLSMPPLPVF